MIHIFGVHERVQDGGLSIKKVPTAKNCADVGTKPVSASSAAATLQVCRIGVLLTMDPYTPLQDVTGIAHLLNRADVGGAEQKTENRNRQMSELVVNIESGAKAGRNHWKGGRVEHFSR